MNTLPFNGHWRFGPRPALSFPAAAAFASCAGRRKGAASAGRGKRGGLRVIYYWRNREGEIVLLTLYAKNEAENIPLNVLREMRKEIKT